MPLPDIGPAPNPNPSVRASVVIVNYNGAAHLPDCLASLAAAGGGAEIVVVDNASTDGSAQAAERSWPSVRVVYSPENLGFGDGCNLGARHARGEYLAFLNPDTVVAPGWLEALLDGLARHPNAGLATSRLLLRHPPDRLNACGNEVHVTGLATCRGMGAGLAEFTREETVGAVSGAAFAMPRALFEALGGFDGGFFLYLEDTDLSLRARLAGRDCLYVPSSVVQHDYTLQFGPRKTYYQERNRYRMLLKVFRWRTLVVLLPALLLAEVVTWGFVLFRERRHLSNKLRAAGWICANWRSLMQGRARTQARRAVRDRDLLALHDHRLPFEQVGRDPVTRLAHLVFDPLFFALRLLAKGLVWW
jgi:hypothetical protein